MNNVYLIYLNHLLSKDLNIIRIKFLKERTTATYIWTPTQGIP